MFSNIRRKLKENKGSQVIEAAIFLPIFIIGLLTLGYLVKFNAVQENVFHSFADETGKIAAEASLNITAPLFYENDVENRVEDENGYVIKNIDINNFRYKIPSHINDNIIAASLDYDINIGLPAGFIDNIPVSDTIICRAFVGDEQDVAPMPFSEMERSVDSNSVWIFPRAGTKFHSEDCSYIKNYPKEMMLSSVIKNRFSPCEICNPTDLRDGNLVYCFSTGSVYHKGECPTVTKYVTSMEKTEAQNRGYAACLRCGGVE
jgi:hypothetical protein